jgi:hypothetical protein
LVWFGLDRISIPKLKSFKLFNVTSIGVAMFELLELQAAPSLPYGYLWEILFATILAVSLVLAIKYPSFGKRWMFFLFVVGVAEFEFSTHLSPYNNLVVGWVIGLVTAYSGIIVPVSYLAKQHLRKKQVKLFFILSGCLELVLGSVSIFYRIFVGSEAALLYLGLLVIGFYSLIVGILGTFFAKPKTQ